MARLTAEGIHGVSELAVNRWEWMWDTRDPHVIRGRLYRLVGTPEPGNP